MEQVSHDASLVIDVQWAQSRTEARAFVARLANIQVAGKRGAHLKRENKG